jgi:agmatine deiminase
MKRLSSIFLFTLSVWFGCSAPPKEQYVVQAEFTEQAYIWMWWIESGFLGGDPFCNTILDAMKAITPHVKIRLLYGPQLAFNHAQMRERIIRRLLENNIDTARVEFMPGDKAYASIQDPGPVFLKNKRGEFAIADFRFSHPDTTTESIDRNIAKALHLPTVPSPMISEGGAWQTNGKGTLLLVEAVELDRNATMTKNQIEDEYKRVLGVTKIIWLKKGAKEEEWGLMDNGIYAIGTAGHIDEFCRFADARTILLAEVYPEDTLQNALAAETFRRMEENKRILAGATDQDGKPFTILRAPTALLMSKKIATDGLSASEMFYLQNTKQDSAAFYLTTGYFNFIIANHVVVTSRYWKAGLDTTFRARDEAAKAALQKAFPGKEIIQIDCMPVHHDGAGLHCHSRSQPR